MPIYIDSAIVKGPVEQLHGEFAHKVQVILMFPSKEYAQNWYHSDEYQALIPTRDQGMESQFQLVG